MLYIKKLQSFWKKNNYILLLKFYRRISSSLVFPKTFADYFDLQKSNFGRVSSLLGQCLEFSITAKQSSMTTALVNRLQKTYL